jgi:iron complex outermembrane receptor protein
MASSMVNWLGNGTEYVGNLGLKPETADKISFTAAWHDAEQRSWSVKVTPYYTYVENYIGVDLLQANVSPGIDQVRFANHDSQIYGLDLSGNATLIEESALGSIALAGIAGFTRGQQINNGNGLYRMQPFNVRIELAQRLGGLSNQLGLRLVRDKTVVNPLQDEQTTPGFAVLDWRSGYDAGPVTISFGVDNLLDKQYYDPNGGAYLSGKATRADGSPAALPATGRSYNVGVTARF